MLSRELEVCRFRKKFINNYFRKNFREIDQFRKFSLDAKLSLDHCS